MIYVEVPVISNLLSSLSSFSPLLFNFPDGFLLFTKVVKLGKDLRKVLGSQLRIFSKRR